MQGKIINVMVGGEMKGEIAKRIKNKNALKETRENIK